MTVDSVLQYLRSSAKTDAIFVSNYSSNEDYWFRVWLGPLLFSVKHIGNGSQIAKTASAITEYFSRTKRKVLASKSIPLLAQGKASSSFGADYIVFVTNNKTLESLDLAKISLLNRWRIFKALNKVLALKGKQPLNPASGMQRFVLYFL